MDSIWIYIIIAVISWLVQANNKRKKQQEEERRQRQEPTYEPDYPSGKPMTFEELLREIQAGKVPAPPEPPAPATPDALSELIQADERRKVERALASLPAKIPRDSSSSMRTTGMIFFLSRTVSP